jgi:prepilin signal peptidase PulO-like enzyme (type II secretory pathway)
MTFFYLIIFIIGLCFGSFTSVMIHRLRTQKGSIIYGRSRCPKCKHVLRPTDLIPLISYLAYKGKCRYCKKKIPNRYPIIELTMGAFFVLTTIMVGPGSFWLLTYYLTVTFIFVLLSFYDIFYQEVPDEISLPTILLVGIVGHAAHLHPIGSLWTGFAIPVLFFSALFFGSQGRWLGGGDIRIGAIMGFLLGCPNILVALFLAYFIGALFSLYGLITKKYTQKSPIPFGPFLFLGAYIALFWGADLINWYMRWT